MALSRDHPYFKASIIMASKMDIPGVAVGEYFFKYCNVVISAS
jgi:hypothetical protein